MAKKNHIWVGELLFDCTDICFLAQEEDDRDFDAYMENGGFSCEVGISSLDLNDAWWSISRNSQQISSWLPTVCPYTKKLEKRIIDACHKRAITNINVILGIDAQKYNPSRLGKETHFIYLGIF